MSARTFRRIGVYCGSSNTVAEPYFESARVTGRLLASRGITIVYGGGRVGLMGALADAALEAGGEVVGVIPEKLMTLEKGHPGLTERFVVDGMRARKAMMAHLADGFMALPGGWGTLEELFEVATAAQLNYQMKPFGLVNVNGYYDSLVEFLQFAGSEGFVRPAQTAMMQVADTPEQLLADLAQAHIPLISSGAL